MHVAVLAIDGTFDSGLAALHDVLATANLLRDHVPPWRLTVVGTARHTRTAAGHRVPTTALTDLDTAPDVLVAPALGLCGPADLLDRLASRPARAAVRAVAAAHSAGTALAGACSATLVLADAGVLDGRHATTSWWLGPLFRARHPAVRLDTRATLVEDRGVRTAGAAFAHIDLALSLVRQRSPQVADLVARYLLIGDRASQAAFAVPEVLARHSPEMTAFERWVRAHLDQPIRISAAAGELGMSERTLQRVTAAAVGMTPIEFVNEVRVDQAAHLLRTTALTADEVAARVGFGNTGTLRALVRRRRGVTLRALRGTPG